MRNRLTTRFGLAAGAAVALLAIGAGPAAAKAATNSFDGSCSLQVTVTFDPPATNDQQTLDVAGHGTGTCDGKLNGRDVSDAKVTIADHARADGSCVRAKTLEPGTGYLQFADGTRIRFTFEFDFVGVVGTITARGQRSGSASGYGSFLTQRTPPDLALQCGGAGVKSAPLDITLSTDSPLVSDRRAAPKPGQPYLRLAVRPHSVRAGRRTTFEFTVTRGNGQAVAGATVHFARKHASTGPRGRAQIVATLDHPGSWTARATKSGFREARATVAAHAADDPGDRASSFSGNCDFSGTVTFDPPLTNTARPTDQRVRAPGTCSGTFVDGRGRTHTLNDTPATYIARAHGDQASCGSGQAIGTGELVFPWDDIDFTMSEVRTGPLAIGSYTGVKSGSARAVGAANGDPVATVQACGGAGLKQAGLSGHLTTTQTISG